MCRDNEKKHRLRTRRKLGTSNHIARLNKSSVIITLKNLGAIPTNIPRDTLGKWPLLSLTRWWRKFTGAARREIRRMRLLGRRRVKLLVGKRNLSRVTMRELLLTMITHTV